MIDDQPVIASGLGTTDRVVARITDGPYRWIDLNVGHDGRLNPEDLVGAIASVIPAGFAAELVAEPDGTFRLVPADPKPVVRTAVAATLRALAATGTTYADVDLFILAQAVERG